MEFINNQRPPQPSPTHDTWDETLDMWVETPESVARVSAYYWRDIRTKRDSLLAKTDWTQLPDVPLITKEAWAEYRQALRDVTNQPDPFNIVWPVAPSN